MQIAPAASAHTEAITTATTPMTTPFNARTTTVEDVAEIDLGGGRRGSQTHWAVRWLSTGLSAHQKFLPLFAVVTAAVALAAPVLGRRLVADARVTRRLLTVGAVRRDAWTDEDLRAFATVLTEPARTRASVLLYRTFLLREAGHAERERRVGQDPGDQDALALENAHW